LPREAASATPQKLAESVFHDFASHHLVRMVLPQNYSENIFAFAAQISLRCAQHPAKQRSA
jgi:hypothetical protein